MTPALSGRSAPRLSNPRLAAVLPRAPRRSALTLPVGAPAHGGVPPGPLARQAARLLRRLSGGGLTPPPRPDAIERPDPVRLLVQRVTYGWQPAEDARARLLGYEAYLEEQLAPEGLDDAALDARLAGHTTLALDPRTLLATYLDDFTQPYLQLKTAVLLRAVHSRRQLLERACGLWNDHFNVHHDKGDIEWALLPEHDRTVIRPRALGAFPELLEATAFSPAMLYYLDNWLNVRGAPQENYARELLELHTLGLRGGYTEADVREVAKCFTGWTLGTNPNAGDFLRALFVQDLHAPGPKFVLGQEIPNFPPRDDARRVLERAAAHPSTARFVAVKLLTRFLTPAPTDEQVERVAQRYLETGGDVAELLRTVLARQNLGPAGPPRKFLRPLHFVAALLRALEADVTDALWPLFALYGMGHVPFGHVQPDGFPDTVDAWGRSLLPRWRFASDLLLSAAPSGAPIPGVSLSYPALAERLEFAGSADRPGLAGRIDERILGNRLSPAERSLLQESIDQPVGFGPTALLESIALAVSLPGAQWF